MHVCIFFAWHVHLFMRRITDQWMCACCTIKTWRIYVPMQEVWMNTSTRQCMHALACFPLFSFLFLPSSSFIFLPSYPLPYLHSFLACLCFVPPASCQHQCSIPRFDGFLKCLVLASSQRLLDFQWMYLITGTGIAAFSLSVSIWTSCLLVLLF